MKVPAGTNLTDGKFVLPCFLMLLMTSLILEINLFKTESCLKVTLPWSRATLQYVKEWITVPIALCQKGQEGSEP